MLDAVNIHKKHDLKQDIFEEIINTAEYNEGVVDFFKGLDRNKFLFVLIYGKFQNFSQKNTN